MVDTTRSDLSEAGAPEDRWILPEGLDPDRFARAVEIVLEWEENGELAIDLVLKLYPVLCL